MEIFIMILIGLVCGFLAFSLHFFGSYKRHDEISLLAVLGALFLGLAGPVGLFFAIMIGIIEWDWAYELSKVVLFKKDD